MISKYEHIEKAYKKYSDFKEGDTLIIGGKRYNVEQDIELSHEYINIIYIIIGILAFILGFIIGVMS